MRKIIFFSNIFIFWLLNFVILRHFIAYISKQATIIFIPHISEMKYICLFFVLVFFTPKCFGQNFNEAQIDSLLVTAEQLNGNYSYAVTLSFKAYDDSHKIGYKKGMAESLLIASRKQHELKEYADMLKNAIEAEKISISISNNKMISDALRLKGIGYAGLGYYKKGRIELNKALEYAQILEDKETKNSRVGVIFSDIALNIDDSGGIVDSVAYFYRKGYQQFEKMVLNEQLKNKTLAVACSNVGASFLRAKELDSASFYLNRALQLANTENHSLIIATTLGDLGSLNYLKKNYNLSIDFFVKAINLATTLKNPSLLKSLYHGISKSYTQVQDDINSKKYLELYIKLTDSIDNSQFYGNKINLANRNQSELPDKNERNLLFYSVIFLVLMLVLFLFYKKDKKIKDTIDIKNPEELNIVDVNESQLNRLVYLASIDDPIFLTLFKDIYPEFFKKINTINSGLISSEQKLCAFLKLDFSTKKIAQCTNSSIRGVEAKKYRLRKKLGIPTDSETNIWMMNL